MSDHADHFTRAVCAVVGLDDATAVKVWRYGLYRARVISQAADLSTVDVQFENADLGFPHAQAVPVRYAPGIKVQFGIGEVLHVGWEGGRETGIYAAPIADGITPLRIVIEASTRVTIEGGVLTTVDGNIVQFNGGVLPIARVTDTVAWLSITGPGNTTVLG